MLLNKMRQPHAGLPSMIVIPVGEGVSMALISEARGLVERSILRFASLAAAGSDDHVEIGKKRV